MQWMKKFTSGVVIGLLLGLWFGVNIGKNRPFYSNPFRDVSVTEIAKEKGKEVVQEGKKALRESLDEDTK
ncbi:MAG: hypothetical protein L0Z73_06515 [Gammaproteobacteria bacterium]|nr:hypothetical protein [Gammaproteobacteria bacterium]